MLFISLEYMFLFLPLALIGYFFLLRRRLIVMAKAWLVAASFFFYNYWNSDYTVILALSMLVNFAIGSGLGRIADGRGKISRRALLAVGIAANLAALAYFKYMGFFAANINHLLNLNWEFTGILLPLGISFFTFQQIAYLFDSARGETREYDFLNYALFVSFFPQLIAGPIVHHREMLIQFREPRNLALNYRNLSAGIFRFIIGLAKKVLLADVFAGYVATGYGREELFPLAEGLVVSLSYTFQIYFDFSGYMDMALGAGQMFNIRLPENFNSPYQASSVQDFWRRWHMTLSRFLRDYLYFPLGGSRTKTAARTYGNVMVTFLLCGLWHGAGWMFVLWGGVHGAALCATRAWRKLRQRTRRSLTSRLFRAGAVLAGYGRKQRRAAFRISRCMSRSAAVGATFMFVNLAWILFRAENWEQGAGIFRSLCGLGWKEGSGIVFNFCDVRFRLGNGGEWCCYDCWFWYALAALLIVFWPRNSRVFIERLPEIARSRKSWSFAAVMGLLLLICVLRVSSADAVSEFIYFNF